jgi:hypothetical protein
MDVAVFRLSKRDKRAGELIRHDLMRIPAKLNSHSGQREHPDP